MASIYSNDTFHISPQDTIPDEYPADYTLAFWGKHLGFTSSLEGEWAEICLVDNRVYTRGNGYRSVINSKSWQVISIPRGRVLSIALFGARSYCAPATIIITCDNAIYQVTNNSGMKTMLSLTNSLTHEKLIQAKYRISHEVSCCFLSNFGTVFSLGPSKESGHTHSDFGKVRKEDYDYFASCFDKAEILKGAMRCVPEGDKIVSISHEEYTLTWQFTTEKGCKIYTRGDASRVSGKAVTENLSTYSEQVSLVGAPLPIHLPTTGETTEEEITSTTTSTTISTGENKENDVPDFDKRERRTEKAIRRWENEIFYREEDYCCFVKKPTTNIKRQEQLVATKTCMLNAIKHNCMTLMCMPNWLTSDKDIVMAAVVQDGMLLQCASTDLRSDKEVVMAAIKQNPWSLKYASIANSDKQLKEIVMAAVKRDGYTYRFVTNKWRKLNSDKEIAMAAVSNYGYALWLAPFKKDKDVVMAAINQDGRALRHASDDFKNNKEIVMIAVKNHGNALKSASKKLQGDKQIVMAAVLQNSSALQFASEKLKVDKDVVEIANMKTVKAKEQNLKECLQQLDLEHLLPVFTQEEIYTLADAIVLTEDDLKEMKIKIGPRRKLLIAFQELKSSSTSSNNLPMAEAFEL